MDVKIEHSWKELLSDEFEKPYFKTLTDFIRQQYAAKMIFPPARQIFSAFDHCPVPQTKVVIIGQDPYHGAGQANGLCFSVNNSIALPPSLINIYTEIENDLGKKMPPSGNLERWAKRGVLLLNATLTVQKGLANSHQGYGWEILTDAAIARLAQVRDNLVFMLWGNFAQQKEKLIDTSKHLILKAVHPSPLSAYRGFFGCKHFSKANNYLVQNGQTPVDW